MDTTLLQDVYTTTYLASSLPMIWVWPTFPLSHRLGNILWLVGTPGLSPDKKSKDSLMERVLKKKKKIQN